ncbi:MAG: response regulator transcription factor [Clostridia bacterium]|nr:response regulator transcription factor [Clostridia bacterium]
MTYRIAICDDEQNQIEYLTSVVSAWSNENGHICEIRTFPSAEAFLFAYEDDKAYDILLLDIEMKHITGVDLAKSIRKKDQTVQIIFITGYSEYISEGYEVAALHYLMKPVSKQKLFSVLDRAAEKIKQNEKCLNLPLSGEIVRVPLHEIKYLDVHQNYVTVHGKADYTVKRTLGEFEGLLDSRFTRVGRAMIINLTYIRRVTKTDVYLSDGTVLPLPRGAYEPLNRAIITHT